MTERELLFFGDVEPDSISSKPQTINVWKAAAPKIPHTLASIFIECSWTSDRPDHLLFGHLNPLHLVDELVALAVEVYKVKNHLKPDSALVAEGAVGPDTRSRKKKKLNPIPLESLRGMLDGVTIYIMHCKSDVGGKYDGPISQVIGAEVTALVEKKGLGVEIVVLEQGTRIREFYPLLLFHATLTCLPHYPQKFESLSTCHYDHFSSIPGRFFPGFDIDYPPFRPSICFLGLCRSAVFTSCFVSVDTLPVYHYKRSPPCSCPLTICSFMFFIPTTVY